MKKLLMGLFLLGATVTVPVGAMNVQGANQYSPKVEFLRHMTKKAAAYAALTVASSAAYYSGNDDSWVQIGLAIGVTGVAATAAMYLYCVVTK